MKLIKRFKKEIVVSVAFMVSRLPSLGYDYFNTDVWKWKTRIYNFGSGVFTFNFEDTIQRYHPGVILMWIGSIGVKIYNFYYRVFLGYAPVDNRVQTIFELHFIQKLLIVVVLGVTVAAAFYVLEQVVSNVYAYIVLLLLITEPFYLALSRVIHLEGLTSTFMLASFVWYYYFLIRPEMKRRLVISGFFASLAVLTKTTALFLLPFMGIISFIEVRDLKRSFALYLPWLVSFILFFVLLWPAMWVAPLKALSTLYRGVFDVGVEGGHEQIYFGHLVDDPGFGYYFVVLWLKSSLYLIIGVLGFYFALRHEKGNSRKFLIYALLYAFLYLLLISIPSKKLSRYILPSIMGLVLVSSFTLTWILEKIRRLGLKESAALTILFAPAFFYAYILHPDYFSYFNPLSGGLSRGIYILEPKWMIGQTEMVDKLKEIKAQNDLGDFKEGETVDDFDNAVLDKRLVVGFQEKYYTQIWPFVENVNGRATIKDLTPHAFKSRYFVYPVWNDDSSSEDRFKMEYYDSVFLRGTEVYRIYKRN